MSLETHDLVALLRRFNRKERYWLLKAAHGNDFETLDPAFCDKLSSLTGVNVAKDSWWAMDYHWDWLSAAIQLYGNPDVPKTVCNKGKQIKGTQEDVDLLVAFGKTLILIEAKGDTAWDQSQFDQKMARLRALEPFAKNQGISLHFILMSPSDPEKLKWNHGTDTTTPKNFMKLEMKDDVGGFVRVSRCDEKGVSDKDGGYWRIIDC